MVRALALQQGGPGSNPRRDISVWSQHVPLVHAWVLLGTVAASNVQKHASLASLRLESAALFHGSCCWSGSVIVWICQCLDLSGFVGLRICQDL